MKEDILKWWSIQWQYFKWNCFRKEYFWNYFFPTALPLIFAIGFFGYQFHSENEKFNTARYNFYMALHNEISLNQSVCNRYVRDINASPPSVRKSKFSPMREMKFQQCYNAVGDELIYANDLNIGNLTNLSRDSMLLEDTFDLVKTSAFMKGDNQVWVGAMANLTGNAQIYVSRSAEVLVDMNNSAIRLGYLKIN